MSGQKLNKKLVKWAGLPECPYWDNAEHDDEHCSELKQFDQDLNACFSCLVPKLRRKLGEDGLIEFLQDWVDEAVLHRAQRSEAETLCLAIEEFIDDKPPTNPVGFVDEIP